MGQNFSWEFNNFSVNQEISLCDTEFLFFSTEYIKARHQSLKWAHWIEAARFQSQFTYIYLNIILTSTPRSGKSIRFPYQNFVRFYLPSDMSYTLLLCNFFVYEDLQGYS